jgi:hypothetical protein
VTQKNGLITRPLAHIWVRGPARRDRDQIVLDSRRAERYSPEFADGNPGIELSRVRAPDDAVRFVERFGLLTKPRLLDGDPIPADLRQPFSDFEKAADDLRKIIRTTMDVRAAVSGNVEAFARIRQDFERRDVRRDNRSLLIHASGWVALALSSRLVDVYPHVFERAQAFPDVATKPGGLRLGLIGETLLAFCSIRVAEALCHEPLKSCEECNGVFIVDDARRRFCTSACATRARSRRYKNKKPNEGTRTGHNRRRSTDGETKTRTR